MGIPRCVFFDVETLEVFCLSVFRLPVFPKADETLARAWSHSTPDSHKVRTHALRGENRNSKMLLGFRDAIVRLGRGSEPEFRRRTSTIKGGPICTSPRPARNKLGMAGFDGDAIIDAVMFAAGAPKTSIKKHVQT